MDRDAVKSARRAFEILELFERERRPLALKDILDDRGYPASSGSALLKSLVTLGYLDYDNDRRTYFPTMRIAALGARVLLLRFDPSAAAVRAHALALWRGLAPHPVRAVLSVLNALVADMVACVSAQAEMVAAALGDVRETAEIWVNGSQVAVRTWRPYTADIRSAVREGANRLEVVVTNTLANRFTPEKLPSGLLGPVTITPMAEMVLR